MVAPLAAAGLAAVTGKGIEGIEVTLKQIKKGFDKLVAASPQLQQSMEILRKGILLYLRPIGDLMSKLFRPFLILFLKAGLIWYKYLSSLFQTVGKKGGKSKTATDEANAAAALGEDTPPGASTGTGTGENEDTALSDTAEGIKGLIDSTIASIQESAEGMKNRIDTVWTKVAEGSTKLFDKAGTSWDTFINNGYQLWDLLKFAWDGLVYVVVTIFGVAGALIYTGFELVFAGFKIVLDVINVGFGLMIAAFVALSEWSVKMWGKVFDFFMWVGELVKFGWDGFFKIWHITIAAIKVYWSIFFKTFGAIIDSIKTSWDKLMAIGTTVFNKLKSFFENIMSLIKNAFSKDDKKDKKPKAVGGAIDKTGMYQLHAGERVLTAGQTQRSNGGSSYSFNMPITINATVSSDIDIRQLASKLAELQETELRRRVSY